MTRFFVDAAGNYLGGWDGFTDEALAAAVGLDAIEVAEPPARAEQRWNGAGYDEAPPPPMTMAEKVDELAARVEEIAASVEVKASPDASPTP